MPGVNFSWLDNVIPSDAKEGFSTAPLVIKFLQLVLLDVANSVSAS